MTIDAIFSLFDTCSFPVFNQVSEAGTKLPYGVMFLTDPDNTAADDIVYCVNAVVRLELYTLFKDYKAMAKVENTLNAARIPWNHDSDYVDTQKCFLEIYSFGLPTGKVEPVPED